MVPVVSGSGASCLTPDFLLLSIVYRLSQVKYSATADPSYTTHQPSMHHRPQQISSRKQHGHSSQSAWPPLILFRR